MIEYIYFVKCPDCEDEPFYFFAKAKEYAMGCLSKKPIITQVEVNRNDFGECTDSTDLGTIWSSDYVIADTEKETTDGSGILTKDFLNSVDVENDPEFAALDNSVDVEEPVAEPAGEPGETSEISEISAIEEVPDNFRKPLTEASEYGLSALVADSINHLVNDLGKDPWSEDFADEVAHDLENNYDIETVDDPLNYNHWFDTVACEVSKQVNRDYGKDTLEENFGVYFKKKEDWDEFKKLCDEIGIYTMGDVESFMKHEGATPDTLLAKLRDYRAELGPDFKIKESRKPVPEGMTIEQLVEEMEENEDMVECTWCNDLFPKDQCRKEVDLGYLCSRCEAAIKSRGEKLTFVENDYWDFLDEEIEEPVSENISEDTQDIPADYDFFNEDFDDPVDEEAEESIFDGAESVEEVAEVLIKEEEKAIDQYEEAKEKIAEVVEDEDADVVNELLDHIKEEEEEHIEELAELLPEESENETSEISEEESVEDSLNEHVNEEHPAIESDQELEGTDNAVVDCKVADVVTHSEDEKPVDCEGENKPLEKPLTEAMMTTCPECGAEKAFDRESGVCNNCGFIL